MLPNSTAFFQANIKELRRSIGMGLFRMSSTGSSCAFLIRGFTIPEGGSAQSSFSWDSNAPFGSVAAGQNDIQNYAFNQQSDVSGNISLASPVYNLTTAISGYTKSGGSFVDSYTATMSPNAQQTYSTYLNRIFDDADFTKPFSLVPKFFSTLDGLTQLDYPPIAFTAAPGQHPAGGRSPESSENRNKK